MRTRVLVVVALVGLTVSTSLAQSVPPGDQAPPQLLGTWRLNVTKSKYTPGPPLRAETRVYTRTGDGVTGVVTRTYGDGQMERYAGPSPISAASTWSPARRPTMPSS